MEEFLFFAVEEALKEAVSVTAREVCLAWGLKEDLTRLSNSWTYIQPLLRAAKQQQGRNNDAVRKWLNKLRDIALDAEDVLDEIDNEGLRREVELRNSMMKKVRDFFSCSNPIAFRFKMAHKVKKINMLLEQIKQDASLIGMQRLIEAGTPRPSRPEDLDREWLPFVANDSTVVGRQEEVSEIVHMLIESGNQEVLTVVPIVGMAGLGKTTIAQKVFNDDRVKGHFDAKIWVCVSENFEAKRILRECLESFVQGMAAMENMNAIIESLQKELRGKKYLLVLDDVWNTEVEKWNSLKTCLLQINTTKGNKIIVTSHNDEVALIMGALPRPRLGELSEEDCWSIFKDKAFASGGPEMTSDLVEIGREIAKKCAGVPLAAKVLGGMMHFKKEIHEWVLIQKNEIWNIEEDKNRILQVLKLSFDNLRTPSLKQCFAYCSMFPKDYSIEKNELIQLWMAQGFLQPSSKSNLEMEDLGYKYFNTLLVNSLLQDATKDAYDNYEFCKMHDLVHDLAQSISSESDTENDEFEIQHSSWGHTREIPKRSARKMRTLLQMDNVGGDILLNFKGLRVLNLRGARIEELPLSIGKLKHLRYLDVSESRIKEFPKSIGKLYHLQTLRAEYCDLEEFPNQLKNLINLRHIYYDNYRITKMPAGMGQLTSLQTLPSFYVGQEKGHQMEELGCLNKLRGRLIIRNLEHVNNGEEAKKANLIGKTNIDQLEFIWGDQRESNDNNEHVLEGLQPHLNLKSLGIWGFGGNKFPSWISNSLLLNNLVEIQLSGCNKCEQLPALGQLPSLREISIYSMLNVKCIGTEFYGSGNDDGTNGSSSETSRALFPALKTFTLCDMENLREVVTPATGVGVVFPRLEELRVYECPSLESIASLNGLTSLRELEIEKCDRLMSPPNGLESCISLEKLTVYKCPNLEYVPDDLRELCSLRSIEILKCGKLKFLPRCHTRLQDLKFGGLWEELDSFPNINWEDFQQLEDLRLWGWPKLKSLPHQLQHLTALRKLSINGFDGLETLPEWVGNLSSLENLSISECRNLVNLPPREAMRRLTKLERVDIYECPHLKELCANKSELECSEIFGAPINISPYGDPWTML